MKVFVFRMGRDVSFEDSFSDERASECGKVRPTVKKSTSPLAAS